MSEKKGIDVSYAQGKIDFNNISKKQVQFAIVRSSYGWESGQKDKEFDRNIKGFHSKSIPCGAYHYSYAQSREDAVKEAEYCMECIKGAKLELPVFLDLEDSSVAQCGKRVCTDIAKAFCDHMKEKGYKTGIYINPNWLNNYVYKDELLGKYEIWLAQWGAEKPSYSCQVWQYKVGGSGSINGINGEIDLDIMYDDTDSGFDASGSGDDILYDFSGPDYTDGYSATQPSSSNVAPAATSALVEVRNARFVDDNRDNIITSNELSKVIFEVVNTSHVTLYNIQPIVEETTGNKHIFISPSVHVESLSPGSAIRYTAMVKADKLKAGTVCFKVSVKTGSQTISKIQEFNIPTAKK